MASAAEHGASRPASASIAPSNDRKVAARALRASPTVRAGPHAAAAGGAGGGGDGAEGWSFGGGSREGSCGSGSGELGLGREAGVGLGMGAMVGENVCARGGYAPAVHDPSGRRRCSGMFSGSGSEDPARARVYVSVGETGDNRGNIMGGGGGERQGEGAVRQCPTGASMMLPGVPAWAPPMWAQPWWRLCPCSGQLQLPAASASLCLCPDSGAQIPQHHPQPSCFHPAALPVAGEGWVKE